MLTHKPSINTVYAKLEKDEPFSDNERAKFTTKELNLIRGIQLRDKEDKVQAMQTYTNYQREGKRELKTLNSSVRKYIQSKYPKSGTTIDHDVSEFERGKFKKSVKTENKTGVFNFLKNRNNYLKNEKTYMRVKRGSVKYPNASVSELRHGVNSQRAQQYRLNHGLTRDYK